MVKKLFLIRHALTEPGSIGKSDYERKLTSEGNRDAANLGKYFNKNNTAPHLVISSSAKRASQTAEIIASRVNYSVDRIKYSKELYETSVRVLLEAVNAIDEKHKNVFLINHNPAITYLSEYLTDAEIGNVVPCGMVEIKIEELKWAELSKGTCSLTQYMLPEMNLKI